MIRDLSDVVGSLSDESLTALLRRSGGRVTPQRLGVLRRVAEAQRHLTAGEVHRQACDAGEHLELSTVHRVLASLVDTGVLHCVFTTTGAAFGIGGPPHSHATCRSCGVTLDVGVPPGAAARISELAGFHDVAATLAVVTLCATCGSR